MRKGHRFASLDVSLKEFLPIFIVLFSAFSWYYMSFVTIRRFLNASNLSGAEVSMIWVLYFASIIGSSVLGSLLSKTRNRSSIYMWMILGTVVSFVTIPLISLPYVWVAALGLSLGVGMPANLAYFADSSKLQNRGFLGGLTFLFIFLSSALLAIFLGTLDLLQAFVLLGVWRGGGLLLFALLRPKEISANEKEETISFTHIFRDKSLRLYLIPWIMFILIDRFEATVLKSYLNNPSLAPVFLLGPIIGSFSAFFGGILSDRVGRKRVMMGGFVALGVAYAAIGLSPGSFVTELTPASLAVWYFYAAVEGIAWGILMVSFLMILWGDLSQLGGRKKYYVIGGTPFYFASIAELLLAPYFDQIPPVATFSLASFFLFIAVLPLLYAPETLSQKHIELRQLKGYVEYAKKATEKFKSKSDVKNET